MAKRWTKDQNISHDLSRIAVEIFITVDERNTMDKPSPVISDVISSKASRNDPLYARMQQVGFGIFP